jgi:hypothetical protein
VRRDDEPPRNQHSRTRGLVRMTHADFTEIGHPWSNARQRGFGYDRGKNASRQACVVGSRLPQVCSRRLGPKVSISRCVELT